MDVILTHVSDSLEKLLSQYRTLPRVTALVGTLAQSVQTLEDAIAEVYEATPLANAVGQQLDNQGAIIGLARNGLDDATYKILLLGTIALNNSDATVNAILSLVQLVWQTGNIFYQDPNTLGHQRRLTPAQLSLQICDPQTSLALASTLINILKRAMPAGCALTSVDVTTAQGGKTFAFAGNQPWVAGFGSGVFARRLYQNPLD